MAGYSSSFALHFFPLPFGRPPKRPFSADAFALRSEVIAPRQAGQ
jgi:hypothetical protein